MNTRILLIAWCLGTLTHAADLPTVTVEHLYYLQARAERVRRFLPDEMVSYCIVQKIGGSSFENLYAQMFTMRVELVKLLKVDEVPVTDPRVVALKKKYDAYLDLLRDEAKRVQAGILSEGQVATDSLAAIARAQNQQ